MLATHLHFKWARGEQSLNEDDFFKRGMQTYIFMTAALWLMSWAMEGNGAAYASNPAWQMISGLRSVFTWIGMAGVGFWAFLVASTQIQAMRTTRENANRNEIERWRERREAAEDRARWRDEDKAREQKKAQEVREREEAYRERLREQEIQKRRRTVEDATQSAMNDF